MGMTHDLKRIRKKGSGKGGKKPAKKRKPLSEETKAQYAAEAAEMAARCAVEPPPAAKYNPYITTGGMAPMTAAFDKRAEKAKEAKTPLTYLEQHAITIEGGVDCKPVRKFFDAPFRQPLRDMLAKTYAEPTPIQSVAWPLLMAGHDLVAIAKTGSGKTCAYLLPIINGTLAARGGEKYAQQGGIQALVLAPTRELIAQIAGEARKFAEAAGSGMVRGTGQVEVAICTGGDGMHLSVQLHEMRSPPEGGRRLLCATPGRLAAMLNLAATAAGGAAAVVGALRVLVLDEADRLLEMGFKEQLDQIIGALPTEQRQTLFFSATWPQGVRGIAAAYTKPSVLRIRLGKTEAGGGIGPAGGLRVNPDIRQAVQVVCGSDDKTARLKAMMAPWCTNLDSKGEAATLTSKKQAKKKATVGAATLPRVLIFTNTKKHCTTLSNMLSASGASVDCLHGDRDQVVRTEVVRAFSSGRVNVLVATDVAARGLDLPRLAVVVNYDFPPAVGQAALEQYVHRVGRTGRMGEQGVQAGRAFTFFDPDTDATSAHGLCSLLQFAGQVVPVELSRLDDGGVAAARGGVREQKRREEKASEALRDAIIAVGLS